MQIQVVSQGGPLLKLLQARPRELHVIVICSSGNNTPDYLNYYSQNLSRSWIMEQFDDITGLTDGQKLMTNKQLATILMYASKEKDSIIVSDEDRTHRGSAIAAVLQAREMGFAKAFNGIDPKSDPNPYVVQLGADFLNMPELMTTFNDWSVNKNKPQSVGKGILKFFGIGR